MRRLLAPALVIATVLATSAMQAAPARPAGATCDRACLTGALDAYVEALVARDPSRLAGSVRTFTENGQRLELGDGLWHTVTGKGRYALYLADAEGRQAVLMGTVREADVPTIFVLRLKVEDRRPTEVETLVIRNQKAAESLEATREPRPALLDAVPAAERMSREALVTVANKYFSGIERNDGKGDYPLQPACARLENGTFTAGGPAKSTCLEQFRSGVFHYVTRIRDRRFVLVDVERGLAFAFAFFDNASGDATRGTEHSPMAARWCLARACRGRGRLPRCSRSSAARLARSNRCSTRCRTAWARGGARGKRRCPAGRAGSARPPGRGTPTWCRWRRSSRRRSGSSRRRTASCRSRR